MNDQEFYTIREHVLKRVESGAAHMRPRAYFIMRFALTAALAAAVLLISAFVLSFIAFSVHESGEDFLLGFGAQGIKTFFALFPWQMLALDVALLFALEWLLQGFKFAYRVSLLNVFIAVLVLSGILAAVINLTPLHGSLLRRADQDLLPVLGEVYESIHDSHADRGVFRGTVVSQEDGRVVIAHDDRDRDADDGKYSVVLPQGGVPALSIGDRVYVFGAASGTAIEASGIRVRASDEMK